MFTLTIILCSLSTLKCMIVFYIYSKGDLLSQRYYQFDQFFLPSLFVCYMYHCVDCEQYLIAFLKSVAVTHRARCNLKSSVFFFQITEIKGEGMIAGYAHRAVRRETRGCQPKKPSWPSREMCMTPLTLRKTRQYSQSNNGGFVFVFFHPIAQWFHTQ